MKTTAEQRASYRSTVGQRGYQPQEFVLQLLDDVDELLAALETLGEFPCECSAAQCCSCTATEIVVKARR